MNESIQPPAPDAAPSSASTLPHTPAALRVILDEHAALAAVLETMTMLVRESGHRNRNPDFRALRAMLLYVDEFPDRLHHVKETTMLFPRLRACTSEADEVLARLDREHARGTAQVRELERRLTAWEFLGETRREAFVGALAEYVAFYRQHMRTEETEVLPLTLRCFGEVDWAILDRAFGSHRDVLSGAHPQAPYVELFRTIVAITPAPFGVGAADA